MTKKNNDIALRAFHQIGGSFPHLQMHLDAETENVEAELDIPQQEGQAFKVTLTLQNEDELHLYACGLWQEWFPCTDEAIVRQYVEAVSGLLSGAHRVVQHRRGDKVVMAQLQRSVDGAWEPLATYSRLSLPFPLRKTTTVFQNSPGSNVDTSTV